MELKTKFAGLDFKNPIVTSAGALGGQFPSLERSVKAGAGAVTLKTPSLDQKVIKRPKPTHKFLREYGLPNMMSNWESITIGVDDEIELIKKIKPIAEDNDCRIIGSLGADYYALDHPAEFGEAARKIAHAGVDMLEIIPFCPYAVSFPGDERIGTRKAIETGVKAAKEESGIPVVAKIAYEYQAYFQEMLGALKEIAITNIHVFTRARGSILDIEKMEPLLPGPQTLIYGQLRRPGTNLAVALAKADGGFEIESSGGVWGVNDCIERIMCGAKLVALHTTIQYHGHGIIAKMLNGLSEFLDRKQCELSEIVGVAVPRIVSSEGYTQFIEEHIVPKESLTVEIDPEKCNGCGICTRCINGAMTIEQDLAVVDLVLCERCGICESMCPTYAISIKRT